MKNLLKNFGVKIFIGVVVVLVIVSLIFVYQKSKIKPTKSSNLTRSYLLPGGVTNYEYDNGISCADYGKYFVVQNSDTGDQSDNVLVKYKKDLDQKFDCIYNFEKSDFELQQYFFKGITSHYLLLDSGTAPGIRSLTVYDLDTKKEVYDDVYSNLSANGNVISYWTPSGRVVKGKITSSDCYNYSDSMFFDQDGLWNLLNLVNVNLVSLTKEVKTDKFFCSYIQ